MHPKQEARSSHCLTAGVEFRLLDKSLPPFAILHTQATRKDEYGSLSALPVPMARTAPRPDGKT